MVLIFGCIGLRMGDEGFGDTNRLLAEKATQEGFVQMKGVMKSALGIKKKLCVLRRQSFIFGCKNSREKSKEEEETHLTTCWKWWFDAEKVGYDDEEKVGSFWKCDVK